jgi:hypothetical protein
VGVLTAVQLLIEIRGKSVREAQPLFKGKKVRSAIYVVSFLFAYPLLLDKIGFILCTLLFTGACLKVSGKKKWPIVVGFSLVVAVVFNMIFVIWLQVQMPKGKWLEPFSLLFLGGHSWR